MSSSEEATTTSAATSTTKAPKKGDQFMKYASIENHYRKEFLIKLLANPKFDFETMQFVATEKVHGANFSFTVVNNADASPRDLEVKMGKRSGYLGEKKEKKKFYEFAAKKVFNEYQDSAKKLFTLVEDSLLRRETSKLKIWYNEKEITKFVELRKVSIFGELFGGMYPHPEVTHNHKEKPIQRGVYYSPDFHFYAFDVFISAKAEIGTKGINMVNMWLNYDDTLKLFEESGFSIHAKPLKIGLLKELLEMDVHWPTKVPESFFNLPPLKGHLKFDRTNISEGVVIKPLQQQYYLDGGDRLILKKKNEDFLEVNPANATSTGVSLPKKRNVVIEAIKTNDEQVRNLWTEATRYITYARLDSVQSKIGDKINPRSKDCNKFIGMYSKDVIEEFVKDYGEAWNALKKEQQKEITKQVSEVAKGLVINFLIEKALEDDKNEVAEDGEAEDEDN